MGSRARPAWSVAVLMSAIVACGGGSDGDSSSAGTCGVGPSVGERPLRVVTTVAPITNIVANIAGGSGTVITGVVPEGTNSHTFEPAPAVAAVLEDADLVFVNGLELEEPTQQMARANLRGAAEMCELGTTTLPEDGYLYDFSFPPEGGKPNPHLWTNPPMAGVYARIVHDALVARDPRNAGVYDANLIAFTKRVDALDAALREATASVPVDARLLLTYHDAYAYFAEEYGWRVVGAVQPSSFDEPTPREVAALIDQIRHEGVVAAFGSEVFPSPVLEQIAEESGAAYVDDLRDDDLPGEPGDADHTWLALMRFDYVTIVGALGGDPSALAALDVTDVATDVASYPQ